MLNRIGLFAYFPLYAVQASILVNFMAEHIYVAVKENRTLNSIVVLDWTYSIGNNNKLNGILFQGSGVQLNAFVNHRISYEGCLLLNILTNIAHHCCRRKQYLDLSTEQGGITVSYPYIVQ